MAPYPYVSLIDFSNIYLWFSVHCGSPENRMIIGKGLHGDIKLIPLDVFLLDIEKTIFFDLAVHSHLGGTDTTPAIYTAEQ